MLPEMDERPTQLDGLPYPVIFGHSLGAVVADELGRHTVSKVAVFFDQRAAPIAERLIQALSPVGITVAAYVPLAGGERCKRIRDLFGLYRHLLDGGADRATCVVAIGGGTVTDAVGFAAATFMRGLRWLAMPTTVLGMVDAAIGGKTAVDLPEGKNLIGAFWDPLLVAGDLDALATLPAKQRRTGIAEMVKAAIVGDARLFESLESLSPRARLSRWREPIVAAARVKIGLVADDPRDSGRRAALNLGHTVGHALEYASNFRLAHGDAVAIGLRAEGLIAQRRAGWSTAEHARTLRTLARFSLPLRFDGLAKEKVFEGMSRDKKRLDGAMRFALPVRIGEVARGVEVPQEEVRAALDACAQPPPAAELDA